MLKPINKKYYNLDDPAKESYVTWDMSDDGDVKVADLVTSGSANATKEDLDKLMNEVVVSWQENN